MVGFGWDNLGFWREDVGWWRRCREQVWNREESEGHGRVCGRHRVLELPVIGG